MVQDEGSWMLQWKFFVVTTRGNRRDLARSLKEFQWWFELGTM